MAISNFPPQAYTRDVLASAYEWMRGQSPSIRELAQDSDSLVALYLQSRRRGPNSQPTPNQPSTMGPSEAESFKQELKTLSEGLKQFDNPTGAVLMQPQTNPQTNPVPPPSPQAQPNVAAQTSTPTPSATSASLQLDSKSHELIQKVRTSLNLGSEAEALRMLIALGYDRIREILPKI